MALEKPLQFTKTPAYFSYKRQRVDEPNEFYFSGNVFVFAH